MLCVGSLTPLYSRCLILQARKARPGPLGGWTQTRAVVPVCLVALPSTVVLCASNSSSRNVLGGKTWSPQPSEMLAFQGVPHHPGPQADALFLPPASHETFQQVVTNFWPSCHQQQRSWVLARSHLEENTAISPHLSPIFILITYNLCKSLTSPTPSLLYTNDAADQL